MRMTLRAMMAAGLLIALPTAANAAAMFDLTIFGTSNASADKPRFLLVNTSNAGEIITGFSLTYSGVTTIIDVVDSCGTVNSPPNVTCINPQPTNSNAQGAQTASVQFGNFLPTGEAQFRIEFDEPGVNGSNSNFRDVIFNNNAFVTVTFDTGGPVTIGLGSPATANTYQFSGAAAVPEPATWAMLIGGFGLVGGAMRRRQQVSVVLG